MRVRFKTKTLEEIYETPLAEIKTKHRFPKGIIKQFKKKTQLISAAPSIQTLRQFRGLNFEQLKGGRAHQYSIRLNIQYRLIFEIINENEIQVILINEISKHYE